MTNVPLLPTYPDGGLRPKNVWTDPTIRQFQVLHERLALQEFMIDIQRAKFARALVRNGNFNDEVS